MIRSEVATRKERICGVKRGHKVSLGYVLDAAEPVLLSITRCEYSCLQLHCAKRAITWGLLYVLDSIRPLSK